MAQPNKFARLSEQDAGRRNFAGDEKIGLDQRLARLEEDIRRLKTEYDIFLNGGTKREPFDTKNRVESTIKRIGDERSITFAQRYHYNSLVARYNSMREMWRRTVKDREEGRVAASAKNVARSGAEQSTANLKVFRSNVDGEAATIENLYKALLEAKTACGESTNELSFNRFRQQLVQQTENFKRANNCERVAFEVGAVDGNVVFKARADK